MTITLSLKVHEGVILAADSASTVIGQGPTGEPLVINVYNNANKIFNLLKGAPIGTSIWGTGSIGQASISMLLKDLRRRFGGVDKSHGEKWRIDPSSYTIEKVAELVREFIFEEHYQPNFKEWPQKPDLGLLVVGYSAKSTHAEEFQIDVVNGECAPPRLLRDATESGMTWNGQIEAISRLVLGYSPTLPDILRNAVGLSDEQLAGVVDMLSTQLNSGYIQEAMPLQDAIDLACFLVDASIRHSQFAPGAPVVGGAIELAAISRHEGFKWIRRKYFYSSHLNPMLPESEVEIARLSGFSSDPEFPTRSPNS